MLDRPTSLGYQRVVCLCSKPALITEERGCYETEGVEGDLQFNRFYYNDMTYLKPQLCALINYYKKKSLKAKQKTVFGHTNRMN